MLIFDINLYFTFFSSALPFYYRKTRNQMKSLCCPLISCELLHSLKNYTDGGWGWRGRVGMRYLE